MEQVRRRIKPYPLIDRYRHRPSARLFVPNDLRIAEILQPGIRNHGIARVLGPSPALIRAVGDALGLKTFVEVRKDGDQSRFSVEQAAGVKPIDDRAARPYMTDLVMVESKRKVLPMDQIQA